jgi:hypothetical protein
LYLKFFAPGRDPVTVGPMGFFRIARGSLLAGNSGEAIAHYQAFAWILDGERFPRVEVEGLLQADFEDDRGAAGPSLGPALGLRFLNGHSFVGRLELAKLDQALDWHHDGQPWAALRVSSLE